MENPINMDDLGVPPSQESSIWGCCHLPKHYEDMAQASISINLAYLFEWDEWSGNLFPQYSLILA